jgi:prepilin-type N-terminal cleavage/methylation domain-containing protein
MSPSNRAFTLVEMLLVVAIIGLLIAILLPSLGNARVAVRETSCRSNMSQIGRGTTAYATDNAGQFPANRLTPNPGTNQHYTWRWLVVKARYVADGDLWVCPGPAPFAAVKEAGCHNSTCIGDIAAHYAYNGAAFWRFSPVGSPDGSHPHAGLGIPNEKSELTLKNVRRPSVTFILLETRDTYPDIGDWARNWISGKNQYNEDVGIIGYWHRRGANWAKVDGSATWSKLYDTAEPDCWWHNWNEPPFAHLAWKTEIPPGYQ